MNPFYVGAPVVIFHASHPGLQATQAEGQVVEVIEKIGKIRVVTGCGANFLVPFSGEIDFWPGEAWVEVAA